MKRMGDDMYTTRCKILACTSFPKTSPRLLHLSRYVGELLFQSLKQAKQALKHSLKSLQALQNESKGAVQDGLPQASNKTEEPTPEPENKGTINKMCHKLPSAMLLSAQTRHRPVRTAHATQQEALVTAVKRTPR